MYNNDLNSKFEGQGKILPLAEAISRFIKPGIKLHLAGGMGGPGAAICEIIRQFYGKKPNFELIQSTVSGHAINLLYCGLLRKMTFSVCVDISPSGKPSKIMQREWAEKRVEFENWSLCSLQQRLLAGALGISFMPTRSITGSTLASDNHENYCEITDPFNNTVITGLVKSLNPDISIIHGCAADSEGNTILAIPYGEDIWGAFASKVGVLVTVEKIVPANFIRKYASLVKIPGYIVQAVSLAPFGVHPFSLANPGIPEFVGYESDVTFLEKLHEASRMESSLNDWIQEWVLDCRNHEDYLHKLGQDRISSLQYHQKDNIGQIKFTRPTILSDPAGFTNEEMILIAASREIFGSVIEHQHRVMLIGAGSRSTSVLIAYQKLKSSGYRIDIISGNGQYGYEPVPGELGLQNLAGVYSSKMVTDTIVSQGIIIGGKNNRCLGILGAGQIDKYGNINSTLTSNGQFLVGSGGANDVGNASEIIIILNQSKDRFVDTLPYITCPGDRVTKVISTMGIYEKAPGKNELHLTGCLPSLDKMPLIDRIKSTQAECGWSLKLAEEIRDIPVPSADELKILRSMRNAS